MKKYVSLMSLLVGMAATAQVKIGDNPTTINSSAVLEVESTNKGFLPPRLTAGQRDAISNPATGLAVFNTTSNSFEVNTGTPASPVWSSAKAGNVSNTTLTSSTSPAGTSLGQMMYNTGSVQPTGLVYWDGTQWKSVASSGGDTTNNYPVTNNSAVTNNSTVTNNNPVTNNSTSTFNGVSTFNDQAVFNDTAVFNGGMKVGNLPQGAVTDSLMVFEPNTKEVRRLSIAGAAAAGEPWYKVGTTAGATANTDDVYLNGKVGVGTTAPDAKLHISGDATGVNWSNSAIFSTNTGTDGHTWAFGARPTGTNGDFSISDETNSMIRMVLQGGTGNVGIGTTAPTQKLDVSGNANISGNVVVGVTNGNGKVNIGGTTASTATDYDELLTLAATDGIIGHVYHKSNGTDSYVGLTSNDAPGVINTPIVLNEWGGNVGIGTNSPDASAALDIASTNKGFLPPRMTSTERDAISNPAKGLMIFNTTTNAQETNTGTPATPIWSVVDGKNIYNSDGTLTGNRSLTTNGNNLDILSGNNGTHGFLGVGRVSSEMDLGVAAASGAGLSSTTAGDAWIKGHKGLAVGTVDGALRFETNYGEKMRIDANGNVGIGTTTPAYPLDAKANINALARFHFENTNAGADNRSDIAIGSNGGKMYMGVDNSATTYGPGSKGYIDNRSGGRLVFSTNGTEQMTLATNGNVAINAADHGAKLNIGGTIASTTATYDPFVTLAATDGPIGTLYHSYNGSKSYIGLQSFVPGDGEKTPIVLGEWGGAVAIGTNNPVAKFTIAGDGIADWDQSQMFMSNTGTGGHTWAMGPRALGTAGDFSISDESDCQIRMTIQGGTGNVGIGTNTPSGKLDVSSAGPTTVNIANTGDDQASLDFINNGIKRWRLITQTTSNNFTIFDQDNNGERLHIDGTTGYVAIGGGMSPKAPLHIGGTTSASFSTGGISYFNGGIASIATAPSTGPRTDASIIAEGNIWSKASIVGVASLTFSDKRIKNIIGQSNASKDLDLLNKIRITDYRMKDVVMQGNKQYKKVIAQEVEAIYPEAVTTQTGFVPNIYQPADKVVRLGNNTYKVSFTNKVEYNTNVTGDLKLYDEQKEITAKVVSKGDNEIVFTTAEEMKGDKLFLFGEEVTDFRAVDYEALSTLNISATQELYREIQALKKQNAVLTAQVGDTKKLETAYAELAAQVKAMQEVLNMPKVQDGTVAERR